MDPIKAKEVIVHKGGCKMNGEIKAKHSSKYYQIKKYKLVAAMIGLVVVLVGIGWLTPLRQVMAMGFERVLIYIDEYSSSGEEVQVEKPLVKDLKLSALQIEDLSDYKKIIKEKEALGKGHLILVNGSNACKILQGEQLVNVCEMKNDSYKVVDKEMRLNKEMIEHLNGMMKAFERCTGKHDMILTSGYRSVLDQRKILQEKINLFGKEDALRWAMLPGYSEHHTGYAVDVSIYTDQGNYIRYKGQDEYGWINQNCYKYGFIRRYAGEKKEITGVVDEEWHYRYIGVPHAYIVTAKNFCFEEYIEYLKQYTFDTKHLLVECEQGKYEIYFVPYKEGEEETEVLVPSEGQYSILGNNRDGYIVTVRK